MTIGQMISVNLIISYLIEVFNQFVSEFIIYQNTKVSISRVDDIFKDEEEKFVGKEKFINGDIEFKDVCFSYKSNRIFEKLNILIKKVRLLLSRGRMDQEKFPLIINQ